MTTDDLATRVDPRSTALSVPSIELTVVDGPERGLRLPARQGSIRIGTALGNELRLSDPLVSRVHAEITLSRGAARLVDHASTNGTFVEGVRVRDADVAPGSTVRVGGTTIRVLSSDEPLVIDLSPRTSLGGLVGASPEMRRVYAVVEHVAPTEATVLIQGETGTGKELLARALHDLSDRRAGPFVPVDCGAIPESLAESELFGHVRGAFSGAVSDRRGVFEEAHGGTLFLDEIGEIAAPLQRKLLRALENREVRRVGASQARALDVRVVAATNRPLAQAVNDGLFREDLFYRLAVVVVEMPPLRARREDIPMLVAHFHKRFTGRDEPPPQALVGAMLARGWPGNVRELRNHVERALALRASGSGADASRDAALVGLDALVPVHLPFKEARDAWVDRFEGAYVRAMLAKTAGNVSQAAAQAGMSRRFLQRVMVRLGMRDDTDD